jgi:hypothetical protein
MRNPSLLHLLPPEMDSSALRSALTKISSLVDCGSQTALNLPQLAELRKSVDALARWPQDDPGFGRASWLATSVNLSGILSVPQKRPSLPDQIVSDCHFLLSYLDAQT